MGVEKWTLTRLGDLVEIKHGWPFKSELYNEQLTGRPIVVSVGNFLYTGGFRFAETQLKEYRGDYPKEYELEPRDTLLIMTCQTPGGEILGIPARVPEDDRVYLHNQRLGKVVVRDKARVDSSYLYWLFLSPDFNRELVVSASGTKILHTSPSRIEGFTFGLPPIAEQRAIAHVLGTLDDKIELNRRMNETLEAIARALFKSWFVDFDPVRAKAEGRKTGLPPEIDALFPDGFEETEIGEVPRGWRIGHLGDLAENARRGVQPAEIEPGTPYIALEHMPPKSIALGQWATADGVASNKFQFGKGEILFGKLRPYFHKVGVAPVDGVCTTDVLVIRPRTEEAFGYVLAVASSEDLVAYATARSTGTKMPRTNWQDLAAYPIVLPPSGIQAAFSQTMGAFVGRINAALMESRTLAATRDALLPKLVSGQLRVPVSEVVA